jgi:hypothetical protein
MDNNWAAENLQVIRTLMERSALYRRALAPIMLYTGLLGTGGGALGFILGITEPAGFVLLWAAVGLAALAGSFLLVRRQAMHESEPFWSPPTRHVSQALNPPVASRARLTGLLVLAGGRGAERCGVGAGACCPPVAGALRVRTYRGRLFHAAGHTHCSDGSSLSPVPLWQGLQLTGLHGNVQPIMEQSADGLHLWFAAPCVRRVPVLHRKLRGCNV